MSAHRYTMGKKLDLKKEQRLTFRTPRLKSNILLRAMYLAFDLLYGKKRTLAKVKVLELLARYPYWAWITGGYHRLSRLYLRRPAAPPRKTARYLSWIDEGRKAQDNEQWHLFLIDDILRQKGIKLGRFRYTLMPFLMAFTYHHLTRLIFRLNPVWSFRMNAAFESHAENEYMRMAAENPEWDDERIDSTWFSVYPRQKTLGDLIRRIALDERDHLHHSLELADHPRRPLRQTKPHKPGGAGSKRHPQQTRSKPAHTAKRVKKRSSTKKTPSGQSRKRTN